MFCFFLLYFKKTVSKKRQLPWPCQLLPSVSFGDQISTTLPVATGLRSQPSCLYVAKKRIQTNTLEMLRLEWACHQLVSMAVYSFSLPFNTPTIYISTRGFILICQRCGRACLCSSPTPVLERFKTANIIFGLKAVGLNDWGNILAVLQECKAVIQVWFFLPSKT